MPLRELDIPPGTPRTVARLRLKGGSNWTAVFFFLGLSLLHYSIAIPAFLNRRWEGYMSATLGTFFLSTAIVMSRVRMQITFDAHRRQIGLRHGIGRFCYRRTIGFDDVHAVRLTFSPSDRPRSRIEILCDNEDIECPPTTEPRQEALCLAMLLNVQLIKVWSDPADSMATSARL